MDKPDLTPVLAELASAAGLDYHWVARMEDAIREAAREELSTMVNYAHHEES